MRYLIIALLLIFVSCSKSLQNIEIDYFGQNPPGLVPEIFAPGIISTDCTRELNLVFSP